MKNILLFTLAIFATGISAQATYYFDTLPSNSDSARLRVVDIEPDGSEVSYSLPYDSIGKVEDYAATLFRSGGQILGFRSEAPDEVEAKIREYIPLRDGIGENRNNLLELLIDTGLNPVTDDTTYYSGVVGSYEFLPVVGAYVGSLCYDYPLEDLEIEREFGFLWLRIPAEFIDYNVYPVAENMFQLFNTSGKLVDVYIKDGVKWKSVKGCEFSLR